jgi:16S rRNA A1518/A1519 N6-dimethyltransferase RsmA/KsgA/DIM1 with predicted DNA glycosylase/AP lyase activity
LKALRDRACAQLLSADLGSVSKCLALIQRCSNQNHLEGALFFGQKKKLYIFFSNIPINVSAPVLVRRMKHEAFELHLHTRDSKQADGA